MNTRRLAASIVLLCLAAVTHLSAQAQQRRLYVTALDKTGAPLASLTPNDIIVREDEVTREVLDIRPATDPMQVAILVDNSQAGEPHIRDYRRAIPAFIEALTAETQPGSRHEVALIALAERPTILADYSVEPERVIKAAQRLFQMSGSGTYLLDGLIEVSRGMLRRNAARPVIVAIVTEGPELSERHYGQVLDPLRESGAALYIVSVGTPRNQSEDRSIVIEEGTRKSGGDHITLLLTTALTDRLKQLANQLTHQFVVTYARPSRLIPPEEVTVSAKRPAITVRGTAVDNAQDRRR
jgi:hypothetical protein